MNDIIVRIAGMIGIFSVVMVLSAMLIWVERRLLALWQDRYGPNRVGYFGLLQVVADMIKIFFKEDWIPPFADKKIFVVAPAIVVICSLMSMAIVPFGQNLQIVDMNIGLLFFLAMSAMAVYSVVLGGWASNSKYSLIGGMRAAAQMVSYEAFMGLALMGPVMMAGSFELGDIVEAQKKVWFFIPQVLSFVAFFVAGIAETHRLPFDLPEAESEIVAGFHAEYSGMKFGMFFVGEYIGVIMISALVTALYFGGWLGPAFLPGPAWFFLKMMFFITLFVLMRGSLPRPRYDQLMSWAWKIFLPLSLLNLVVTGGILVATS
ncbi:NADH-quinone oxidoreductase subunit NuoH [bacterium]|nr:NADH-quinone oxidoreductase subunit NuoH [bacterium]